MLEAITWNFILEAKMQRNLSYTLRGGQKIYGIPSPLCVSINNVSTKEVTCKNCCIILASVV